MEDNRGQRQRTRPDAEAGKLPAQQGRGASPPGSTSIGAPAPPSRGRRPDGPVSGALRPTGAGPRQYPWTDVTTFPAESFATSVTRRFARVPASTFATHVDCAVTEFPL